MAPEFPPKLVIWDLRFHGDELSGTLEYVEMPDRSERLRVRWAVDSEPAGFSAVGGGVAYVHHTDTVTQMIISEDSSPEPLGNSRYRFQEGLPPQDPWLMTIAILPKGFTLLDSDPTPVSAKEFRGRLAVYWVLEGDKLGRTRTDWGIKSIDGDLAEEVEKINRSYGSGKVPAASKVEVDRISVAGSPVNIFLDKSQQINQSGGVSLHSEGDIATGGDVVGRDKTGGTLE